MTADDSAANGGIGNRRAYDDVRHLTRSRLAWEYLRRNQAYLDACRCAGGEAPRRRRLADGTRVLALRHRQPEAEAWGLSMFHRSKRAGAAGRGLLAGRGLPAGVVRLRPPA
ncbi:transcriptional regulator domain-containing protein [Rhodovibrio sodomensis]|uniref:transcriptional regulator domain-containing protein n=1 Tax=Rhodovibrio sodomensis TaxID=1088 RepID=UPI003F58680A